MTASLGLESKRAQRVTQGSRSQGEIVSRRTRMWGVDPHSRSPSDLPSLNSCREHPARRQLGLGPTAAHTRRINPPPGAWVSGVSPRQAQRHAVASLKGLRGAAPDNRRFSPILLARLAGGALADAYDHGAPLLDAVVVLGATVGFRRQADRIAGLPCPARPGLSACPQTSRTQCPRRRPVPWLSPAFPIAMRRAALPTIIVGGAPASASASTDCVTAAS